MKPCEDWWDALAEPFNPDDLAWRVMSAKQYDEFVVKVYAYVTARAIHERLDEVVGHANWCNTQQNCVEVRPGVFSLSVGISIRIEGQWVTKYNVSEATRVEAAKGAFSGAEKRAAEEWGIGRYLWMLGETRSPEVREKRPSDMRGWKKGTKTEGDKASYYWKIPTLPAWALPKDPAEKVTKSELTALKSEWCEKFAVNEPDKAARAQRFAAHVFQKFGKVPADHATGWTQRMLEEMREMIRSTKAGTNISGDVPFG